MSIVQRSQQFVEIDAEVKDLERQVKELKKERAAIEAELLESMAEEGMQSVKLQTGQTVYLYRQVWASARDMDALCHTLDELGLGDMIKTHVNAQTLSSWVREHERDPEAMDAMDLGDREVEVDDQFELPEGVRDLLKITEKFQVRARKA